MTSFKIAFHQNTGRRIVEVFDDSGEFVASIYPTHDGSNAIHIVSKHFEGDPPIVRSESMIPVPGYFITFKRRTP